MNKSEAGRLGGLSRAKKHTFEELSEIGKKGGRPRLPTYSELVKNGQIPSLVKKPKNHTLSWE